MNSSSDYFHDVMRQWLRSMNLTPPDRQEVYSISYPGEFTLHVCLFQPEAIELLAEAGPLHNRHAAEVLVALLAFNRFSPLEPALSVGIDTDSAQVFVHARAPLAELRVAHLQQLSQHMQARVDAVRLCMRGESFPDKVHIELKEGRPAATVTTLATRSATHGALASIWGRVRGKP